MNFDDTARIFGSSEKLSPELFTAYSDEAVRRGQSNCLTCDTLMVWGPAMQVTNGRLVRVRDRDKGSLNNGIALAAGSFTSRSLRERFRRSIRPSFRSYRNA
jgi:hypothetical protein